MKLEFNEEIESPKRIQIEIKKETRMSNKDFQGTCHQQIKVSGSLDKVEGMVSSDKENIKSLSIQAYNIQEI